MAALINQLELTRPVIVGWSMGGRVAYTYAARHPEDVSAIALLEPASPDFGSPPAPVRLLMGVVPPVASIIGWPRLLSAKRAVFDSDHGTDKEITGLDLTHSEYVANAENQVDTAAYNKFTAATRREMESSDSPTIDFGDINVPMLAITEEDPASNHEETVAEILGRAPNARREVIPDGAHSAHLDNSDAFNTVLRAFLTS